MKLTRRHAVVGLLAATPLTFARGKAATVSRAGTAFGTTVRLTVTAQSDEHANKAIDAGFAEIRAIGKAFNLFDPASEVSRLNAQGSLRNPSSLMRDVLHMTDHIWKDTDGAFDPTVQPLWQAWKQAHGSAPSTLQVEDIRKNLGWQNINHDQHHVRFTRSHMAVTFNGIAQGYAADRVAAALRHHQVFAALIDTGETAVLPTWGNNTFAIRDPRDKENTVTTVEIADGFIATSGDYASRFTPDFSAHHIFDPKTARSPQELSSVTVHASSGAEADAYATAMLVLGLEKSLMFTQRKNLRTWLVSKNGTVAQG